MLGSFIMKPQKLLYLHGFNSSPQSHKAQLIQNYMHEHKCEDALLCPQIPEVPEQAKHFLEKLVEKTLMTHRLSFVGSSLGGYYATYLAEKYTGAAALINPSVKPFETLAQYFLAKINFIFKMNPGNLMKAISSN